MAQAARRRDDGQILVLEGDAKAYWARYLFGSVCLCDEGHGDTGGVAEAEKSMAIGDAADTNVADQCRVKLGNRDAIAPRGRG